MKLLLSKAEIDRQVQRLACEIGEYYGQRPLTIVGVMTGSIVFLSDLIRLLDIPLRVGVVQARSYRGGDTVPGSLTINDELLLEVADRDVLLVDDIFDTGLTLFELLSRMDELRPASLRSAVLLRKEGRQRVALAPDHVGFQIPNEFVVGYGLDYQDMYRNLPYLAALEPAELSASGAP